MLKGMRIINLASTTWAQFRSVPRGSFLHLDTQQILDHTLVNTGGHEPTLWLLKHKAKHTTNWILFTAWPHTGIILTQGWTYHTHKRGERDHTLGSFWSKGGTSPNEGDMIIQLGPLEYGGWSWPYTRKIWPRGAWEYDPHLDHWKQGRTWPHMGIILTQWGTSFETGIIWTEEGNNHIMGTRLEYNTHRDHLNTRREHDHILGLLNIRGKTWSHTVIF